MEKTFFILANMLIISINLIYFWPNLTLVSGLWDYVNFVSDSQDFIASNEIIRYDYALLSTPISGKKKSKK